MLGTGARKSLYKDLDDVCRAVRYELMHWELDSVEGPIGISVSLELPHDTCSRYFLTILG